MTWVSHQDGDAVGCAAEVPLEVTTHAVDGDAVTRVAFLVDGIQVAQTTDDPYTVSWLSPASGEHALQAIVSTMRGQQTETATVTVSVADASVILMTDPFLTADTPAMLIAAVIGAETVPLLIASLNFSAMFSLLWTGL